jgi:hypothetical protein
MNGRPDPDRADHEADDDVWRDLVSRLRSDDPRLGPAWSEDEFGPAPLEPSAAERAAASQAGDRSGPRRQDAGDPGFDAFDPLGLTKPHPEPSRPESFGEPFPHDDEPDGDGEFVPEEPDPVLAGADPASVVAWVGALGAPAGLLLSALFWRGIPAWAIAALVASFIASVGYLIMRLPRDKDEDDDGARI